MEGCKVTSQKSDFNIFRVNLITGASAIPFGWLRYRSQHRQCRAFSTISVRLASSRTSMSCNKGCGSNSIKLSGAKFRKDRVNNHDTNSLYIIYCIRKRAISPDYFVKSVGVYSENPDVFSKSREPAYWFAAFMWPTGVYHAVCIRSCAAGRQAGSS